MPYDLTDDQHLALVLAAEAFASARTQLAERLDPAEHQRALLEAQAAQDGLIAAVDALRGPHPELVQETMRLSIALDEALDLLARADANILGLSAGERLRVEQWYDDRRAFLARHGRGAADEQEAGDARIP